MKMSIPKWIRWARLGIQAYRIQRDMKTTMEATGLSSLNVIQFIDDLAVEITIRKKTKEDIENVNSIYEEHRLLCKDD